jgi:MFS family permease
MVCGNEYIKSTLQSIIALGSCIGFFVFPYFADNKGRKMTMIVAWICFTIGTLLTALANGYVMAGFGQFMMGFGGNAAITLDFSFINEQCAGRMRQYFSIAECLVGYVLFWLQDWRVSVYIMLGVAVLVNFLHIFLLETPKYMLSRDLNETVNLFNRIAKINGREQVTYDEVLEVSEEQEVVANDTNNLLILFKYKSLRDKTLACGLLFLGLQIIYYCAILSLGSLGYESYQNQLAIGVSEGISYIVAQFSIPYLPRRLFSFIGISISGLLCLGIAILTILTQDQNTL